MECPICIQTVDDSKFKFLECMHSLCRVCYHRLIKKVCPFCRTNIKIPTIERPLSVRERKVDSWEDRLEEIETNAYRRVRRSRSAIARLGRRRRNYSYPPSSESTSDKGIQKSRSNRSKGWSGRRSSSYIGKGR